MADPQVPDLQPDDKEPNAILEFAKGAPAAGVGDAGNDIIDFAFRGRDAEKRDPYQSPAGQIPAQSAGRVLRLQAKTGLPADLIVSQLDTVEQEAEKADFDAAEFLKSSPIVKDWIASDPVRAAAARNDLKKLSTLEYLFGSADEPSGVMEHWRFGRRQAEQAQLSFLQLTGEINADQATRLKELETMDAAGDKPEVGFWRKNLAAAARQLPQMLGAIESGAGGGVALGTAFGTAAAIGGQAGPQAALPEEIATVPVGFATGYYVGSRAGAMNWTFQQETGGAWQEFSTVKDENGRTIDPGAARLAALVVGGVNAGLEVFALRTILKNLPGGEKLLGSFGRTTVKALLRKPTVWRALGNLAKRTGQNIGTEVSTEILQEATTILGRELSAGASGLETFKPGFYGEAFARLGNIAEETARSMTILGTAGPVAMFGGEIESARRGRLSERRMKAIDDFAGASELKNLAPAEFQDVVDKVATAGGSSSVFVRGPAWKQYWQDKGADPREAYAEIVGDPKGYDEAVLTGGDIVVPIGKWADKVAATPHHAGLGHDATLFQGALTPRENEQFQKDRAGRLEQLQRDFDSALTAAETDQAEGESSQLVQAFVSQAESIGVDPDVVATSVAPLRHFVRTATTNFNDARQAEGKGRVSSDELFAGYGVRVLGPGGNFELVPPTGPTARPSAIAGVALPAAGVPGPVPIPAVTEAPRRRRAVAVPARQEPEAALPAVQGVADPIGAAKLADKATAPPAPDTTTPLEVPGNAAQTFAFSTVNPDAQYAMTYRVVPLASLVTSHDAAGNVRPDYPASWQQWNRGSAASRGQVQQIGSTSSFANMLIEQHALDRGTPIVNRERVVVSGNGRTLGLTTAAGAQTAAWNQYQGAVVDAAKRLGLSTEGITDPVLVREIPNDMTDDQIVELSRDANAKASREASPVERARVDAEHLSPELIARLPISDAGSLDDALITADGAAWMREFLDAFPAGEWGRFADTKGRVGAHGIAAVKLALFHRTFGGDYGDRILAAFTEIAGEAKQNLERALFVALPRMASLRGKIEEGETAGDLDITADIVAAIDVFRRLRAEGTTVEQYRQQGAMFERELSPFQEELLEVIEANARRPVQLGGILSHYAAAALKQPPPGQGALFGFATGGVPKAELWTSAVEANAPEKPGLFAKMFQKDTTLEQPVLEDMGQIIAAAAETVLDSIDAVATAIAEKIERLGRPYDPNADLGAVYDVDPVKLEQLIDVYRRALPAVDAFEETVNEIARDYGSVPIIGPVKTISRVWEKAKRDYNGDPFKVRDVLRASLLAPTINDARLLFSAVSERFELIRVKDRFVGGNEGPNEAGYSDILANFSLSGVETEIQIHVPEMLLAKEDGHQLYEIWREAMYRGDLTTANEALQQQRELYAAAMLAYADRLALAPLEAEMAFRKLAGEIGLKFGVPAEAPTLTKASPRTRKRPSPGKATKRRLSSSAPSKKTVSAGKDDGSDLVITPEPQDTILPRTLYQPAYHGGPYDFEAFDESKIGSGEGANAYGWGLYFADAREIAEHYRKALAPRVLFRNEPIANADAFVADVVARYAAGTIGKGVPSNIVPSLARDLFNDVSNYGNATALERVRAGRHMAGGKPELARAMAEELLLDLDRYEANADDKRRGFLLQPAGGKRALASMTDDERIAWYDVTGNIAWYKPENWRRAVDSYREDVPKIRANLRVLEADLQAANPADRQDYDYTSDAYRQNETYLRNAVQQSKATLDRMLAGIAVWDKYQPTPVPLPKGQLYQVEIAPNAESFLVSDRYLSDQTASVKEGLAKLGFVPPAAVTPKQFVARVRNQLRSVLFKVRKQANVSLAMDERYVVAQLEKIGVDKVRDKAGEHLYNEEDFQNWAINMQQEGDGNTVIAQAMGSNNRLGHDLYRELEFEFRTGKRKSVHRDPAKAASKALLDVGIRGIRFRDATSRSGGEEQATFNHVLFQDADVQITQKFYQDDPAAPFAPPGERWTIDPGAIPGEPAYILDADATGYGPVAIVEIVRDGKPNGWQAMTDTGDPVDQVRDTLEEAAIDGEDHADFGGVSDTSRSNGPWSGRKRYRQARRGGKKGGPPKGKRGSIDFPEGTGPRTFNISLFENADLSTLLHETGHFYLEVLGDLAAREDAPQRVKDDFATVLRWFGVDDRKGIKTEHHEQWARGFEAYLLEGKAPSLELAGAFARFRAWLLGLYKSVTQLNVEVPDELRRVFDRMLATDEEIAAAELGNDIKPMFTDAHQAGMTNEEYAAYTELSVQAHDRAIKDFEARAMDEARRETEAWWQKAHDAALEEAAIYVDQRRDVRAESFLRRGKQPDGSPLRADMPARKFDRAALEDVLRAAGLDPLEVRRKLAFTWAKAGGVHPDVVAEMFGYGSGSELVQELIAMRPRSEMIRKEADAAMALRYGSFMEDQTARQQAALEAIHNDLRGQVFLAELRALQRKVGDENLAPEDVVKQFAARIVAERAVKNLDAEQYRRQSVKARKEATAATAAGDYGAALDAKRKEILNYHLWRQVWEARKESEETYKYLRRSDTPRARARLGKAGATYLAAHDSLLEDVELKRVTNRELRRRTNLKAWMVERQAAGDDVAMVPDDVRDEAFQKNWRELTVAEWRQVRDISKNIDRLARLKTTLKTVKEDRIFDEAREELLAAIKLNMPLKGQRPLDDASKRARDRARDRLASGIAGLTKIEELIRRMDGGRADGPWSRYVWDTIAQAEHEENRKTLAITKKLIEVFEELPKEYRDRLYGQQVHIPELGQSVTYAWLVAMALNTGNASNYSRLIMGRPRNARSWGPEVIQAALNRLSTEDMDFVQRIWDTIETMWPEVAALEQRLSGLEPVKIDRQPFEFKGKKYEGGYFPVIYDKLAGGRAGRLQADANSATAVLFTHDYARAMTPHGHTIARVESYSEPLKLSLENIPRHMVQVIHDLTHREALLSAYKIVADPEIRGAMFDHLGEAATDLFIPWLRDIAGSRNGGGSGADFWTKFVQGARGNAAVVALGYKVTTILQNFANIGNALEQVPSKYLWPAIAEYMPNQAEWDDFIDKRSGEMKGRSETLDRDIRGRLEKILGKRGITKDVQRFAFAGMAFTDALISRPTWLAAYRQQLDQGEREETAIAHADRVVRLAFGTGSTKDLVAIQRESELMKLLTVFYTYFSAVFNRFAAIGFDARTAKSEGRLLSALPILLARSFYLWIIPALLSELLSGREPDEDETWAQWAARKTLLYPLLTIPFLRNVASAIDFGGDPKYSPAADLGKDVLRLGRQAEKYASGEGGDLSAVGETAFKLSGYVVGAPTGQASITGGYLWDVLSGDEKPEGVGEFVHDLLYRRKREKK